ncbi:MAG: peptidase [Bacillales bacterium]|jgi:D-alanyl-D-alanine carboxypeptidase|nr:peptidase [Bacillales bacterium]
MKRILIMLILTVCILSGCSANKDVKEKSSKIESNKKNEDKKGQTDVKEQADPNSILLPKEYFNVLETINNKKMIQNPENDRMLVNTEFYLAASFVPDKLVAPEVQFTFSEQNLDKRYLSEVAAKALESMFAASKESGHELRAVSGYRSYQRQTELFNAKVKAIGEIEAEKWVARPGTSEHQTGLSMDISSLNYGNKLEQGFDKTKEFQWLSQNAYKFGFILRYPANKEDITKHSYEPWHYRYIGIDVATEMVKRGLCFEEFMTKAKPI